VTNTVKLAEKYRINNVRTPQIKTCSNCDTIELTDRYHL